MRGGISLDQTGRANPVHPVSGDHLLLLSPCYVWLLTCVLARRVTPIHLPAGPQKRCSRRWPEGSM